MAFSGPWIFRRLRRWLFGGGDQVINYNGQYQKWASFRFMGRRFLALDTGENVEIYGDDSLTPMYVWLTIANFKKHAKAGKLPEFFPATPKKGQ